MNPELGGFDIISPEMSRDWLVIGWFTPDYRGLAERFAGNLNRFAIPHHLFAKPIGSGWDTSRKPSVILEAMDLYPGKTIILMDVDCIVDGDIRPVLNFQRDVGFTLTPRRRRGYKQTILTASSRVAVFKPTPASRRFAESWRELCVPGTNDEVNLVACFVRNGDVSYAQLDQRYAAWEVGEKNAPRGTVIWHQSAHAKATARTLRSIIRLAERPFRRGRSRAIKAAAANFGQPAIREAAE